MRTKNVCHGIITCFHNIFTQPLCVKRLNVKAPLDIKTYDGGNQCLHPSCLFFHDGWKGYKFWLVVTPYKEMNEAIENPCVYCSNDGERFYACENANPLDNISLAPEFEYNSDPEMVYNQDLNRIECWWRRVLTSKYPIEADRNCEILYCSYSYDGVNWSPKESILRYSNAIEATRGIISPSIIYENGVYDIWVTCSRTMDSSERTLVRYSYRDGECIQMVSEYKPKHSLSHICAIKENGEVCLVGFAVSQPGFPYVLYRLYSDDKLIFEGTILRRGKKNSWDGSRLYRPYILQVDEEYWLYYSAYQKNPSGNCHVGLLKFHSWKELLNCFIP